MSFGERLSSLRKSERKTQLDIARILGIARTTYASYEQGHRQPDFDTLNKLADFFGVTTDFLLTGRNVADLPDQFQHYFGNPVRNQLEKLIPKGTEIELNGNAILRILEDMTIQNIIKKYFKHIPQFSSSNNFQVFYDGPDDNLRFAVPGLIKEKIPFRDKPDPLFLSYILSHKLEYEGINLDELSHAIGISKKYLQELIDDPSELPSMEIVNKLAAYMKISPNLLIGLVYFPEQESNSVYGEEVKLTPEELRIFEELKKHPILFHDLASDPEKKVKELIKLYKMKKMFLEDDEEEYGDGFGDIED